MKMAAPEVNFVLADSADIVAISSIRVLMLVMAASRFQRVKASLHRGEIHVLGSGVQFLKALFCSLELELFHQLVDGADGLLRVFLKVFVVELHLNNAAVYLSAHSVLTSPHARAAIRSKIGRMAGLM